MQSDPGDLTGQLSNVLADLGVAVVRYHGVGVRDPEEVEEGDGMASGGGRRLRNVRDVVLGGGLGTGDCRPVREVGLRTS